MKPPSNCPFIVWTLVSLSTKLWWQQHLLDKKQEIMILNLVQTTHSVLWPSQISVALTLYLRRYFIWQTETITESYVIDEMSENNTPTGAHPLHLRFNEKPGRGCIKTVKARVPGCLLRYHVFRLWQGSCSYDNSTAWPPKQDLHTDSTVWHDIVEEESLVGPYP